MKKIHTALRSFLKTKRKTSFLIIALIFLVSSIAIVVSKLKIMAAIPFGFSIICFIRLITYKNGKIPFISSDKTWQKMRLEYPKEEAKEKYKELSIKNATTYFTICVLTFVMWIVTEILAFILNGVI